MMIYITDNLEYLCIERELDNIFSDLKIPVYCLDQLLASSTYRNIDFIEICNAREFETLNLKSTLGRSA